MTTLTQALRTAQSGLLVNQRVMDTIAQNVSNMNTPGYSRKVANLQNVSVRGAGSGVEIAEVQRKVDEGLLSSLRRETGTLTALTVQTNFWKRMQDQFGSPGSNTSIAHQLQTLVDAVESLALTPERALEQREVVRQAQNVTLNLEHISRSIQELRQQADAELAQVATDINSLINEIGELNNKIVASGTINRDTTDLRDQRDLKLTELSGLVDIRYFYRGDGDVVVFTSSGRTLVDNTPPSVTHTAASTVSATTSHAQGSFSGLFVGDSSNPANDITNDLREGKAKGLVDLRDHVLPDLQAQLDGLAQQLRDTTNAIHNRGVGFPGAQSYSGTRAFIEPDLSTIQLDPSGSSDDVRLALFNSSGDQQAQTTLNTIMTAAGFSSRGSSDDWTITDVAATMQSWLRVNGASGATVSINSSTGKMAIAMNQPGLNLAFRDETASTAGSDHEDAVIAFDSNGDGETDQTVSGFANFFGLNDLFVDSLSDNMWQSDVLSTTFTTSAATLTFRDGGGLIDTYAVTAGQTLDELAAAINLDPQLSLEVTASVVSDGSGQRLRLANNDGVPMAITQAAGNTLLTDIGMAVADVGLSSALTVRADILNTPGKLSTGAVLWDGAIGSAGQYLMSAGNGTTISQLADALSHNVDFDVQGGLSSGEMTLVQRAAAIVANNASLAAHAADSIGAQQALQESLLNRHLSDSGVNIDEELAQLIIYQQAFSASARVISTINSMFDALENIF